MKQTKNELIQSFIKDNKLDNDFEATALNWFIPAAELIYRHQVRANKPFFVGLNGCQGSGKSTLTAFIQFYLSSTYQVRIAVISLDDFYYPQTTRQQLAKSTHPLLASRGVPGTHDCALLETVLHSLKDGSPTVLPRFNKASDNPQPEQSWPQMTDAADIVIFEGWCWGTSPQTSDALLQPINELEQNEDENSVWRAYVNTQLTSKYEPLYSLFDFWLMLQAPSFQAVSSWRKQQEAKLRQTAPADQSGIMSDSQIERFIQHFQRLTEHSLTTLPNTADLVLSLDPQRQILDATGAQQSNFNELSKQEGL